MPGGRSPVTIRPGSYNAAEPEWHGTLRESSFYAFVCTHAGHRNQRAATKCARKAFARMKEGKPLPRSWVSFLTWVRTDGFT